jgi:hypothetical protein
MYEENNGGISQSADYGDDWDNEGAPNTGDNALIIHKDKLFSGYHRNTANNNVTGVWFRQNKTGSPSWTNIPGPIINSVSANLDISCIAMATNNDNVMYIASTKDGTDGHSTVWRTDNIQSSSPTWISVGSGLPVTNRSVASIVVDPNNANHLWAFMGQFDDDPSSPQRAFFSSDGGAHWNNASSGLGGE